MHTNVCADRESFTAALVKRENLKQHYPPIDDESAHTQM